MTFATMTPAYCVPRNKGIDFVTTDDGGPFGGGRLVQLMQQDDTTVLATGTAPGMATLTATSRAMPSMRASIRVIVTAPLSPEAGVR